MLHYLCNTTCYHICTVLLHSLGSQNIILFTTLLYSIYSINFTIFTSTVLLLYRISFYILSQFIFFSVLYIHLLYISTSMYTLHSRSLSYYHFFFCCKLSKSIDSIYSLNTFQCFVISSNLFTGHFFFVLSWTTELLAAPTSSPQFHRRNVT